MLADMHVHSTFSFDGEDTAETLAERAAEMGVQVLALTDHLDVNEYNTEKYRQYELIPKAAENLPRIKEKYKNRIKLLYGIELGQAVHDCKETERLLNGKPLDVIIGSVHAVRGEPDFYYIDYKNRDCDELLGRYFSEVLETAQWGGIDVIAHLTYPLRYIVGRARIDYPPERLVRHDYIIDEILRTAAKKNIALEINTGGKRALNYGEFDPPLKYVKRFKELGGEIITLGSDAHRTGDLACGIEEAARLAKEAGFEYAAYYLQRKPFFYKL